MGAPPASAPLAAPDPQKSWMGGTDHTIATNMEDELVRVDCCPAVLYEAHGQDSIYSCITNE